MSLSETIALAALCGFGAGVTIGRMLMGYEVAWLRRRLARAEADRDNFKASADERGAFANYLLKREAETASVVELERLWER